MPLDPRLWAPTGASRFYGRAGRALHLANLLSRTAQRERFASLEPEQLSRFESRLLTLRAMLATPAWTRGLERGLGSFDDQLDELENSPSLVTALDLLDVADPLDACRTFLSRE